MALLLFPLTMATASLTETSQEAVKKLKGLLPSSPWSEVGKVRDGDPALKRQLFNISHPNASF